jgi:HAMP domain-containing protein
VLSLIAAIWLSRPLRRIAAGARAVAAGDLGHVVSIRSRDELGEVAHALGDLATQLRERLLEAGADRIALRVLVDELPVGVIVYDLDGHPQVVNGAARELLHLDPARELTDAAALPRHAAHADAIARAEASGRSEPQTLALPWRPDRRPLARWITVPRADGARQVALLVVPPGFTDASMRAPGPAAVETCGLAGLVEAALGAARPVADARGVSLAADVAEPDARVIECEGRIQGALTAGLERAIAACPPGAALRVRAEGRPRDVRLALRVTGGRFDPGPLRARIACVGGDAGASADGEESELWLIVPRA